MEGYAAQELFSPRERELLRAAQMLVEAVPYELDGKLVRCHELARAVAYHLDLEIADGHYGFMEHSWLWTKPLEGRADDPPVLLPNVLDVYTPGALPQVQLVYLTSGMPERYNARPVKDLVIREDAVQRLIGIMGASALLLGHGMELR